MGANLSLRADCCIANFYKYPPIRLTLAEMPLVFDES